MGSQKLRAILRLSVWLVFVKISYRISKSEPFGHRLEWSAESTEQSHRFGRFWIRRISQWSLMYQHKNISKQDFGLSKWMSNIWIMSNLRYAGLLKGHPVFGYTGWTVMNIDLFFFSNPTPQYLRPYRNRKIVIEMFFDSSFELCVGL